MPSALPIGDPAPADGHLPGAALLELRGRQLGFYVHVPFCTVRCGYCDFNTYTADELGPGVSRGSYADTVLAEIRLARDVLPSGAPPVSTVFFGGGTPTLLPAEHLGEILKEIAAEFGLAPDAEITTEANPETVAPAYLAKLREAGFNRISLGMQSAVPSVLAVLDRTHRPERATQAVAEARAAGFDHVNLDLIYGTPGETEHEWQRSLDAALSTDVDHISAYALIVEDGTALARKVRSGRIAAPDDDVLADRYVQADEAFRRAGLHWYEVSNWARNPAAESRHNRLYWSGDNWWGLGPGAHSHIGGLRWWNVKHPTRYTAALDAGQSPAAGRENLSSRDRLVERLMLEVRLREGLDLTTFPLALTRQAEQSVGWGLAERAAMDERRLVLTQRGRLLADAVVRDLLDAL
ncbi:radical SAM family heme chaperone HemW [Jatrophihabitans telluris]|uniref:Heme chaperone HemW n=1 Tax=Jatrophihabitans telluris TaxID=2038343 RepID=A0ABY4QWH8_9ACTN|nr:radical SAM family heme chaperone HemW [Jatrophihabitans telluris]UQX87502.1 radical SAM family heme chaperone HemW [Jatrophihabitans telluris]